MALSLPYYYGHSGEQYAFFRRPIAYAEIENPKNFKLCCKSVPSN